MTDYPAKKQIQTAKSRRGGKWSGFAAILIFGILLLVILGSFLKAFLPNNISSGVGWDGRTSLAIALNTKPASIIVYGKEPSKVGVFTLSTDLKYATGNANDPINQVRGVFSLPGPKAERIISNLTGVNVSKYIYFRNSPLLNQAQVNEMFKQFSSVKTPFSIILGKNLGMTTDLSKMELLRLWWDVKGFTLSQIDILDSGSYSEDIIGADNIKFRGIDRESVNREMAKYFDGVSRGNIEIINSSGVVGAGSLASDMLSAYGWNVVNVGSSENVEASCRIMTPEKSSDVALLASIFRCNIIQGQNEAGNNPVMFLGSDFAKRYF